MNIIFWAADSTVQTNDYTTYPQTGIGQAFPLFLKDGYTVENHAKNGRSTKSFIDEGRLKKIEEKIGEGDFLFIQFGHNDEKINDPSRYTEPGGSYKSNLREFIRAARVHGAYPVLISSLERRFFGEDGKVYAGEHGEYVEAMKETAKETDTPFVDLYSMSREALSEMGEEKSRKWYMYFSKGEYATHPDESLDNTHLRYEGAVNYASMIARGLRELGGIYSSMLIDNLAL